MKFLSEGESVVCHNIFEIRDLGACSPTKILEVTTSETASEGFWDHKNHKYHCDGSGGGSRDSLVIHPLNKSLNWHKLFYIHYPYHAHLSSFQSWFDFDTSGDDYAKERIIAQEREQNVLKTLHQVGKGSGQNKIEGYWH